jgi:hypothetical protein
LFIACKSGNKQVKKYKEKSKSNIANILPIPIFFEEYGIEILDIPKLGDTILYNVSSKDDFKLVFF